MAAGKPAHTSSVIEHHFALYCQGTGDAAALIIKTPSPLARTFLFELCLEQVLHDPSCVPAIRDLIRAGIFPLPEPSGQGLTSAATSKKGDDMFKMALITFCHQDLIGKGGGLGNPRKVYVGYTFLALFVQILEEHGVTALHGFERKQLLNAFGFSQLQQLTTLEPWESALCVVIGTAIFSRYRPCPRDACRCGPDHPCARQDATTHTQVLEYLRSIVLHVSGSLVARASALCILTAHPDATAALPYAV